MIKNKSAQMPFSKLQHFAARCRRASHVYLKTRNMAGVDETSAKLLANLPNLKVSTFLILFLGDAEGH